MDIISSHFTDFSVIFTSIILDALPFILLGSFVSALIQIYLSNDLIERIMPKRSAVGYFLAALIGLIFPVCECAIVPITRRLIKKGVPVGYGITFMLSVPIVNPVVIMSTYYAFYDQKAMVFLRTIGGFVGAIIIGILVNAANKEKDILKDVYDISNDFCTCGCNSVIQLNSGSRFMELIQHTNREFLDIMRYLIFGAFLSGIFQAAVGENPDTFFLNNKILSILFMMFLGFMLSLCSEADAFVARSFLGAYSFSAVNSFLLIGPMLDLKNLIILLGCFKKKFVMKLSFITAGIVFLISIMFMFCNL